MLTERSLSIKKTTNVSWLNRLLKGKKYWFDIWTQKTCAINSQNEDTWLHVKNST